MAEFKNNSEKENARKKQGTLWKKTILKEGSIMEQNNELQVVEEQDTEVSVVEDEKKSGLGTGAGIVLGLAVSYGVYKAYKGIKSYIRKKKAEQEFEEPFEEETEEE